MGYGRIKKMNEPSSGEWIQKIINSFSHLYCCFNANAEHYRNGIYVTRTPEGEPFDIDAFYEEFNSYVHCN